MIDTTEMIESGIEMIEMGMLEDDRDDSDDKDRDDRDTHGCLCRISLRGHRTKGHISCFLGGKTHG